MPLGLKFLHSHKKPNKSRIKDKFEHSATSSCDDVSSVKPNDAENSEEVKSISDPNLHISAPNLSEVPQEKQSFQNPKVEEEVEPEIVVEELNPLESEALEEHEDGENIPEEMVSSFFDNNGNPVDEDEEDIVKNPQPQISDLILKDLEVDEPIVSKMDNDDDEPKCFINAATLSDEDYPPSGSPTEGYAVESKPIQFHPETQQSTSSGIRRVPISRSYPDIVQTTMNLHNHQNDPIPKCNRKQSGDEQNIRNVLQNSLIQADSLEEIPQQSKPVKAFERVDCDAVMLESVLGITNEKPPDSWDVDFNSFSLEAEVMMEQQRSRERQASTSSNSNSLAYFISIDEIESESETINNTANESSEQKKIFSMFVDIGNSKEPVVPEPQIPPVMTNSKIAQLRGRTSSPGGGSINKYGCKNQFSSPGPRTNSRGESKLSTVSSGIPKKIEKSRYDSGGNMTASSSSEQDRNNMSNRSSLHVAQYHDGSFTSSLLSSMENSAPEEAEVCQGGPCFKLGMDLLRMFQEGINTDVNISVRGRYVKAHKCILASRSQYFAALLSGNWIQKAGNTIYLDEFTYNVVQFTMYHIYSGTNEIPDTIDLVELATLTDLLGLEGLREVISQTIRAKFCHNFHRPCTTCISGVLEFFPLTLTYGMDELHRKMIKWICKHFVRIWPTKAFASLGNDLTDKCLRYSVNHLSAENLLDITLGCDQLLSTMPSIRWTELVFSLVNQLSEACVQFVGQHLSQVLQSQRFLIFGKGQTWNISRIDNTFLEGIKLLGADEACLSHVALCRLIELGTHTIDEVEWSPVFVDFLNMLRAEVEKLLLANASKAVLSKNWELLSTNTRKMICSTSFMGSDKSGHNKIQITKSSASGAQAKTGTRPVSGTSASGGRTSGSAPINSATITRATSRKPKESVPAATVVSPTVSIEQNSSITTPTLHSSESSSKSMKVASVRPMPKPEKSPVKVPTKRAGVTSTVSTTKTGRPAPQKEQSFEATSSNQASRVSSASSSTAARRGSSSRTTPMKPLTPMTPSAKVLPSFPRSSASRNLRPPSPPKEPAKKPVFLTNSEKAKAVSKPKLIVRTNRSNSITNETSSNQFVTHSNTNVHSRQSSLGSAQSTPRTPNMSQNSRFASTPTAVSTSTVPVVKLKTNSEKTIKPPNSPLPKSRYLSTVSSRLKTTTNNISHMNSEPIKRRNNTKASTLMTKSTTEVKQEEPKTRTLAEIGRSNTFSKDEPTILGKLEVSQDYDYEYE